MQVTKENLKEFQKWLMELKPRSDMSPYTMGQNVYFELPLAEILAGAPTLSPIAQDVIANIIVYGRGQDQNADAETLLNLAESQPILLGKTYAISGNSRDGHMYSLLLDKLEKRPFEKNIPAIYAMMHYSPVYGHSVGTGEIGKTSAKNAKILNKIFENSAYRSHDNQFQASSYEFIGSLDMGKLLNFEGASPEFRARINAANFNAWNNNKYEKMAKLNPELIDEQILSDFINTPMPKQKDLSGAKNQKEKNANILPISYTKPRDALMHLVERQEIHDRNNYGKLKTLSQRFNDLKARMQKAKTWPVDNPNYETLARDVYLKAIQRDIIDGRAADLSAEQLQMALATDKDGFYVRKVPDDVLGKLNIRLNRRQNAIVSARNSNNPEMTLRLNNLSSADKRAVIERAARTVAADAPIREQLDAELAKYDTDYKEVKSTGADTNNANTIYTDMNHIQSAYKRIRANFKDGAPNAAEAHLSPSEMERAIYEYITGASDRKIDMPTQKSLPLFGRGTESARREGLEREIRDFNKTLADVRGHMTDELVQAWTEYRGAILNPESVSRAGNLMNTTSNIAQSTNSIFQCTHRKRDAIESDKKRYTAKKESLDNAKATFDQQQKNLRELSRRHMGRNQSGELTAVTDDMSPEEKRAVRKKNRETLNDTLAARKNKKPARNLAEMLKDDNVR